MDSFLCLLLLIGFKYVGSFRLPLGPLQAHCCSHSKEKNSDIQIDCQSLPTPPSYRLNVICKINMEPCYPSNAYKTYLLYLHSTWVARRPPRGVIAEKVGKQWASGGAGRYRELNSVTIWWEKKCLGCWMGRKFLSLTQDYQYVFAMNIIQRKHPLKTTPEMPFYSIPKTFVVYTAVWWTQNSNF